MKRIYDVSFERNIVEFEPVIVLNDPVVNQPPIQPNVESIWRRSQHIRRPALSDDYTYLYESDFNIDQANSPILFDEVVSCSDSDN